MIDIEFWIIAAQMNTHLYIKSIQLNIFLQFHADILKKNILQAFY